MASRLQALLLPPIDDDITLCLEQYCNTTTHVATSITFLGSSENLDSLIILFLLPSALFLLCLPVRLYQLIGTPLKTLPNYWGAIKSLIAICLAALQLAALVVNLKASDGSTISIISNVLLFVATLAICPLSFIEHSRNYRPSGLLELYLLVTLILEVTKIGSLRPLSNLSPIVGIAIGSLCLRLLLFFLEIQDKRSFLREPYRSYSQEVTAGIVSKALVWWINPLFIKGNSKLLSIEDLPTLDGKLSSGPLRRSFQQTWDKTVNQEKKLSLLLALTKCLWWPFLSVVIPRLTLIVFRYAQPILISRAISYMNQPVASTDGLDSGSEIILAAVGIYVGMAICTALYRERAFRLTVMMQSSIIGLVHNRSLTIQDGVFDDALAVTLMSTDTDSFTLMADRFHDTWSSLIEVVIGTYLLARQVGWMCVIPLLLVLACSRVSRWIAGRFGGRQKQWSVATQQRIAVVRSMLDSIKSLKMLGLADIVEGNVNAARTHEIDTAKGFRRLQVLANTNANTLGIFAPSVTLIAYAIRASLNGSDSLDTKTVFTSLAIILLVTGPANVVLTTVARISVGLGSLQRIHGYLMEPSVQDERVLIHSTTLHGKDDDTEHVTDSCFQDDNVAISMDSVTIRPSPTAEPVLKDIDLRVESGSIVMISGAVGTGKTSLARAILGFVKPDSGLIQVSSKRIALCAQTSWLPNDTVKNIVIGPAINEPVDESWYGQVVYACGLKDDLNLLPHGDQSLIGSRGLTLSGGQRQRVALARAVYARLPIIVLDDVFSALDNRVGKHVAENLLGPRGLFRSLRTTVVLITHSTQFYPLADHIVILGKDNKIAEQGSWDMLKSHSDLIMKDLEDSSDHIQDDEDPTLSQVIKSVKPIHDEKAADLKRKTGDTALYNYYFRAVGGYNFLILITSVLLYSLFLYLPNYWLKWWTDAGGKLTAYWTGGYILIALLCLLSTSTTFWATVIRIGPQSGFVLHKRLLHSVMRAPLSYFSSTDTGSTLNRFSQDMRLVDRSLPPALMRVSVQLFKLLAQCILLYSAEKYLAVTFPFFMLMVYIVQKVYLRTSRQLRLIELEAKSEVYSSFLETLEGISTIRAFGWQHEATQDNIERVDTAQLTEHMMFVIQRWLNLVLDLLIAGMAVMLISLAVTLRGSTTGAQIGIALNVILAANVTVLRLVESWTQMETSLGAISRIRTFEQTTIPEDLPDEDFTPPESWPQQGAIEFHNLTAAYNPEALALRNLTMKIEPGQKVGICGRTGSGKSSLLLTLLRLVEIQSGTIIIDNLDISKIPREIIRTRIIAIPQDPFIFNATVRFNADPFGLATGNDALIISALEKVQLWSVIEPRGGLDANMKQHPLSQGQQQLFALARALIRKDKGRILLLDEATSNVDAETDGVMQRILREEFEGHTIVTVAHRLDTIGDSDVVAVLEGGELVEFGPPAKLAGRENGAFRKLGGR